MSGTTHPEIQLHIPEDLRPHLHQCKCLKTQNKLTLAIKYRYHTKPTTFTHNICSRNLKKYVPVFLTICINNRYICSCTLHTEHSISTITVQGDGNNEERKCICMHSQ